MWGAGAPGGQGQHSGKMGVLGRPRVILLTRLLVALELTFLFMRFSIMPYLTRRLGLDSVAFGYLQTAFGVLQLLGGPVFGRFADQRGARAAFTLSFLASSAFYLILAAACSPALPGVALLYVSPLPAALMHGLPAAQMVITDLSAPEERQAALGRLGLCFGVGMIFGSLLGGTLSAACGLRCPASVALVANLVAAVLSFTCIPISTKGVSTHAQAAPPGRAQASVFDLKAISRLLLRPGILPVFLVKVVSGFPSGLFMVMFSIISMDFFQLDAAQAAYLMSFFGVLQMVIQGLVIGWLSSHFSERALLRTSVLGFIMVGLPMALMSSVFHFCLLMPGLVFSLCALNVVTDSMLTKAVSASDTGTMLGLCASVQPLTRTLGPMVGGLLYRSFGVPVFGHVQFATNVLVLLALWRQPLAQKPDKVW
ncbi:PREDICTED: solute carrier family 22 member 18 [Odobenus rosmarus divergens]|uniref:Organic cation transporter-like protein 2 n=1 Tax=Odobenus rosmarus divergens TaxID=9708 RepID=A0A2U3W6R2_ODORO|nr:PREDICTED: solute carrier family 22 member 18 [Odobenus rosmarus divergens]